MLDRERKKVIKGLLGAEISLRGFANHFPPLREECHEQADACHDALALLQEQEDASKRNPVIVCPHCGKRIK